MSQTEVFFDCEQTRLPERSVGVSKKRAGLGIVPISRGTLEGYELDWMQFNRWATAADRNPLPATSETLEHYMNALLLNDKKRVNTAARSLCAIFYFHRQALLPPPDIRGCRKILAAVKNARQDLPKGKAALRPDDLRKLSGHFDAKTALGARNRALVVLGFAASLRRNELGSLQLADVAFEKEGLAVMVRDGPDKRAIGVWAGRRAITDPVRALRRWLEFRGDWTGPLFCHVGWSGKIARLPLSGAALTATIGRGMEEAGLDRSLYGIDSLRTGADQLHAERQPSGPFVQNRLAGVL